MKVLKAALAATALATCAATPAKAHFQLVYTPEVNLEKAGEIPLLLAFWHPFANGHAMDMGKPLEFFVIHKGEKTDLLAKLSPISFRGAENAAAGFEAKVPVRRLGDYIFVLVPAPYLEKSEGKFIQQITKSFVNQGGVPGGWNEPVGLATEIVPLNKPTNILAGSTFSGVVLSEGKPVAGAEIEIEYLAAEPDIAARKPGKAKASPPRRRGGRHYRRQRRVHLRPPEGRLLGLRRARQRLGQAARRQAAVARRGAVGACLRREMRRSGMARSAPAIPHDLKR